MSQLLKILSLRQHGIVFNNAFDGLLADFSVGHSARIPTAITSQCVCQQVSFKFVEDVHLIGFQVSYSTTTDAEFSNTKLQDFLANNLRIFPSMKCKLTKLYLTKCYLTKCYLTKCYA